MRLHFTICYSYHALDRIELSLAIPFNTESCLSLSCSAYETLSDDTRRREYDQQPFNFNIDDIFKDFDIYSQNRHARHRRHFEEHSRSHKESHSRHKRHFQGGFGAGIFDDVFGDIERMTTFDRHTKQTENGFHGASKQHCRTVTQRRGNMVTTYTDCIAS